MAMIFLGLPCRLFVFLAPYIPLSTVLCSLTSASVYRRQAACPSAHCRTGHSRAGESHCKDRTGQREGSVQTCSDSIEPPDGLAGEGEE